eukprot:SAG25_NODE_309_length_10042_cov_25.194609_6_plen_112_part_00
MLRGRHHAPRRRLRGRRRRRAPRRAPPAHRAQIRCECTARPRRARARALQLAPYPRAAAAYYAACAQRMATRHNDTIAQPSFVAGATPKAIEIGQPQSPWWVPANVTHHPE